MYLAFTSNFFGKIALPIKVVIKINPIKTPIVGTVGISKRTASKCPEIQLIIPKNIEITKNGFSFRVIKLAKEAGITSSPITIIAPTLSKL